MMTKRSSTSKQTVSSAASYDSVLAGVVELLDAARRASSRAVNAIMTATYWEMGRRIVEFEQGGKERADYGEELLKRLSRDLTSRFGRGFSVDNLERSRRFYVLFTADKKSATPLRISPPALSDVLSISATASRKSVADLFQIPGVWESMSGGSTGTNVRRRRLNPAELLQREIPLPPLVEQRRMVARIEELAVQIHEARTLRRQAADEAEALVISNHVQLAGKRTRRLGEFIRLEEDAVSIQPDGSYPQVGVKSFGGGLFPKSAIAGTGTTYRTFNRLFDGALVLSQVKGWEGALAVCPKNLAGWFVSPEYRTFRCVEAAEVDALKRLQAETATEIAALLPAVLDRAFRGEL